MSPTVYPFSHLKQKDVALDFLASHLTEGTLVLFLGAGASIGFGLPSWLSLVNSLRSDVGLPTITKTAITTADDLQRAADEVIDHLNGDNDKLMDLIEKYLYRGINSSVDIFNNHLLIAVSALLMGSKRGHVKRVVTLNYDSMLEWFLSLFGFNVKTVADLPTLEGSEDVRIYHPHGFVPHKELSFERSKKVILGMQEANRRIGETGNLWYEKTRQILDSGVCLFIGMSANSLRDRALSALFTTCADKTRNTRPIGIWILLQENIDKSLENEFFRFNIVPLAIDEPKKISQFLLKICQKALEKLSN